MGYKHIMKTVNKQENFDSINTGYNKLFKLGRLSIGLTVPIENYSTSPVPTMEQHIEIIQMAEALGFAAIWLRDVPFNVPSFGDAGQVLDPFVYLGALAVQTERITLGVASIILPLRHPAHIAKAASSIDSLSGGRLVLGVASGDRPEEYPALNVSYQDRGQRFRDSFDYIGKMASEHPAFTNRYGQLDGSIDMLPKPSAQHLPLLLTGSCQQSPDWLAQNGDGWITYPRTITTQAHVIGDWRQRILSHGGQNKPAMQPLYVDLSENPDTPPEPIHLGFRSGVNYLHAYLKSIEDIGINHIALNLRFNKADVKKSMTLLAEKILPDFHT